MEIFSNSARMTTGKSRMQRTVSMIFFPFWMILGSTGGSDSASSAANVSGINIKIHIALELRGIFGFEGIAGNVVG